MAPQNRKRAVETIDLTGSDNETRSATARPQKAPRLSDRPTGRQSSQYSQHYDEEEEDREVWGDAIDLTQDYNDPAFASFQLYGA